MTELAVMVLLATGAAFMFLAALGLVRMPDLYMRVSACTKAATLGVSATMVGTLLFFDDVGVSSRAAAIILFVLLTGPVAGHMIGRAAYLSNAPLWKHSVIDELRGRYDRKTETLHSAPLDTPETPHTASPNAPEAGDASGHPGQGTQTE